MRERHDLQTVVNLRRVFGGSLRRISVRISWGKKTVSDIEL